MYKCVKTQFNVKYVDIKLVAASQYQCRGQARYCLARWLLLASCLVASFEGFQGLCWVGSGEGRSEPHQPQ